MLWAFWPRDSIFWIPESLSSPMTLPWFPVRNLDAVSTSNIYPCFYPCLLLFPGEPCAFPSSSYKIATPHYTILNAFCHLLRLFLCLFSSSYFWVVSGWSGSNGVHPLSKISIELKRRRKAHSWMLELTIKEGINRKLLCLEGSIWQDSTQFLQQALRDPIWDRCLIHVCGINKWLNVFSYLVVLKHFWNHGSSHWLEQWLTVWVPVIKYWGPLRKSLLFPHSI